MNLLNPLRTSAYKEYKKQETQEHHLKYLFLEITRRCNLNCRHCGSDCSKDSSMVELQTDEWLRIIDETRSHFSPYYVVTGGEPLVHPQLDVIAAHIHKRRASWGMVTNGMALSAEKLNQLISLGLNSITLSLDGNEESHLYLRRDPRSWHKVNEALQIIGSSQVPIKDVVTCVTPTNLHSLHNTAELLIKNNITNWRLFRIFPKGAACNHPELLLSFDESNEMVQWIAKQRKTYRNRGLNLSFSCEGYLPYSVDRKVRDEPFFCRAGINIASILADGSITGCNNNGEEFYQGTITSNSFSDIWHNKFEEYRSHKWKRSGACQDCKDWTNCLGNSIHLRSKSHSGPDFCYMIDIEANQ